MKPLIPAALAAPLLAGCALDAERKQALADAALLQVQILNKQGVDPINLDETQLALLASGCALIPVMIPEVTEDVLHTCAVAMEAAK